MKNILNYVKNILTKKVYISVSFSIDTCKGDTEI